MGYGMEGWISGYDIDILPKGTQGVKSVRNSVKVESLKDKVLIKIPMSNRLPIINRANTNSVNGIRPAFGGNADLNVISYNNAKRLFTRN
ncbi:MAG: hypothetical protein MZV70_11395 [Desulfobacterales bacterium]|nr:hypothetical protein [Desulfobacterales bacterium]